MKGQSPFTVGGMDVPRVLVCIEGNGEIEHEGTKYSFGIGDVLLLPAMAGVCAFRPNGSVNLLGIAIPD